jgi:hypothetical protein
MPDDSIACGNSVVVVIGPRAGIEGEVIEVREDYVLLRSRFFGMFRVPICECRKA